MLQDLVDDGAPFANFVVFVLLCLLPGTPGPNRYGDSPRQDDLLAVA